MRRPEERALSRSPQTWPAEERIFFWAVTPEIMALDRMRKDGVEERLVLEANLHNHTDDPEIIAARARFDELYKEYKKETDSEHEEVVECRRALHPGHGAPRVAPN